MVSNDTMTKELLNLFQKALRIDEKDLIRFCYTVSIL